MQLTSAQWNIVHLRQHLQYAVDLELWTIPFYLSAQYSIIDRRSDAYQLVQTVVHQEMLHIQLAANVANAFGLSPTFGAPVYQGQQIPHLDFALDHPDPRPEFSPYSAEIGPFDRERLDAMCLIEYPEWLTGGEPRLFDTVREYGSIGELYDAIAYGAGLLKYDLRGGVRQVDYFSAFYRDSPSLTVSAQGEEGFRQAILLLNTVRWQGEGTNRKHERIPAPLRNTADDAEQSLSHFAKFDGLRRAGAMPLIYPVKPVADYTAADRRLLEILTESFTALRATLRQMFAGEDTADFVAPMVSVGASVQSCWKHGVTPRFNPSDRG